MSMIDMDFLSRENGEMRKIMHRSGWPVCPCSARSSIAAVVLLVSVVCVDSAYAQRRVSVVDSLPMVSSVAILDTGDASYVERRSAFMGVETELDVLSMNSIWGSCPIQDVLTML